MSDEDVNRMDAAPRWAAGRLGGRGSLWGQGLWLIRVEQAGGRAGWRGKVLVEKNVPGFFRHRHSACSQKVKHVITMWPSNSPLGMDPKGLKQGLTDIFTLMFTAALLTTPKGDTAQTSLNGWWVIKMR